MENNITIEKKDLSLLDIENQLQSIFYPTSVVYEDKDDDYRLVSIYHSATLEKYSSMKYEMMIDAMFFELDQQNQIN